MPIDFESALGRAKALIFDCDGTLVNSLPVYSKAWGAGFALSGTKMNDHWYQARNGLSEHVLMDEFERDYNVVLDRKKIVATMRSHYRQNLSAHLTEISLICDIARRFYGQLPMAVASGGSREIVTQSLDALGLTYLFQKIISFDDVRKAKPLPDLFLHAAQALGIEPRDCLVFEDSPQGIEAAHAANMSVINVDTLLPLHINT